MCSPIDESMSDLAEQQLCLVVDHLDLPCGIHDAEAVPQRVQDDLKLVAFPRQLLVASPSPSLCLNPAAPFH